MSIVSHCTQNSTSLIALVMGSISNYGFSRGGGGDTPYKGPIRRGSARKGLFFRLQVNEREGISLVEVYKNGRENCHFRQKWYIKG